MTASSKFGELITNEIEFKLFQVYSTENLAANLIDCFEMILEYQKNGNSKIISEIFDQFVNEDAPYPITFNESILNPLIHTSPLNILSKIPSNK